HVQPFALDVQEHVLGKDALGWIGVMGTAGGVNMVVAAVEAKVIGVDPALQLDADVGVALFRNGDRALKLPVLGPSAIAHRELAWWQQDRAAVMAVDLLLKEKVGR